MDQEQLNNYIRHYVSNNKTGSAIMLTGAWGAGKSHYAKNSLVPTLEAEDIQQTIYL